MFCQAGKRGRLLLWGAALLFAVLSLTVCSRSDRGETETRSVAQEGQGAGQSAASGAADTGEDTVRQKYALVIGNGAYASVAKLNNPVNDASDIKAALESLGFTVDMVVDGGLDQMESAAVRLRSRLSAERNSYGFFFYAGHAVQSAGENYLIPVDANIQSENFLRQRAVSVQSVLGELNDAGNALNIVVLDACRDNPFSWSRSGSRGLQVVSDQPADSIIVYATSAGKTADDNSSGRNGLFTTYLLANLKTPGLSVQDIFNKTGADVRQASGGKQIPAIYSQFFETAYLGNGPAVAVQPAPVQPVTPPVQPAPQPKPVVAVQPAPTPRPAPTPVQPVAPPVRQESAVDVYAAGYEFNAADKRVACYWKNGVKTALSDGRNGALAEAIAVSGSDVYVSGWEANAADKSVACYWKNGVKTTLSDGRNRAGASAIAVSGSDVYAAGYEDNAAGTSVACYWKNGVKTALSDGRDNAQARAIAVSGSDVYVAGREFNAADKMVAWYWKNGVKTALSDGRNIAWAVAIVLVAR
jgi:hypothetical protein